MKKILILLLMICILNLTSCTLMSELQEEYDIAVNFAKEFCNSLINDDFERSKEYLHPYSAPSEDRFDAFISKLEETNDIDFSKGIEIQNIVFEGMAKFDNIYGGSNYRFQFELLVGDKAVNMFFVVVDNDIGYGIFYFGIIE